MHAPERPTLIRSGALELGACIGAAVALGAYRLFGLGGGALGHREDAVAFAALALVVVAVHVRDYLAPRPPWAAMAGAAIVAGVLAFALARAVAPPFASQRLERWSLPGLTVDVPAARPAGAGVTYASGVVQAERRGVAVLVSWSPGVLGDEAGIGAMASGAIEAHGEKVTKAAPQPLETGLPSTTIALRTASTRGLVTQLVCGARVFVIETFADPDLDLVGLHRRVLRSVSCTPDAAEDARLVAPAIEVDAPGWEPESTPTTWRGPSGRIVVVETPRVDVAAQLPGLSRWVGLRAAEVRFQDRVAIGDRTAERGTFESDGQPGEVLVLPIDCADRHFLVVYLGVPVADDARAALAATRCR